MAQIATNASRKASQFSAYLLHGFHTISCAVTLLREYARHLESVGVARTRASGSELGIVTRKPSIRIPALNRRPVTRAAIVATRGHDIFRICHCIIINIADCKITIFIRHCACTSWFWTPAKQWGISVISTYINVKVRYYGQYWQWYWSTDQSVLR